MPPQQRARKIAAAEPDTPAEEGAADQVVPETHATSPEPPTVAGSEPGPICGECFPGGWDARPDAATVGCEHGTYTR